MGQKVNPIIFRIGQSRDWSSRWFSIKRYADFLRQDVLIRKFIKKKYRAAGIAKIDVERSANAVTVIVYTGKPGLIIGRGGAGIEELRKTIKQQFLDPKVVLNININEVPNPNLSASLLCLSIITDIEKRIPFRRAMKQAMGRARKAGAEGARILCSGRLNGAEIARRETLSEGKLPLHTIRADIDYARDAAFTTYGVVGVRVWIYHGEKFQKASPAKTE